MPRPCGICVHDDRQANNQALLDREPFRNLAERTGTSATALFRHKAEHQPVTLIQAAEAAEVAHGGDLLNQLVALQDKILAILTKAEAAGDLRTALMAIREARGTWELVAKITGQIVDRKHITGNINHNLMAGVDEATLLAWHAGYDTPESLRAATADGQVLDVDTGDATDAVAGGGE